MNIRTWEGVQSLLDQYAAVRAEDTIVVPYTSDSAEPAGWVSAALECRGMAARRVWMHPLHDPGFAQRLAAVMPSPQECQGRVVVLTLERDTLSHNDALMAALAPFEPSRRLVLRAINASESLFATALRVSPQELSARNTAILERCLAATRLRITSRGGTDLRVTLANDRHRWVSNRGSARPGGITVLPAGEVATFPATVEGVLVADFAFNINVITERDARLHSRAVTVHVDNRRAVGWHCADADIMALLDQCFAEPCARNVGELGFGTNFGVDEGVALNSHINERRPGVHLGFGQHNQDPRKVGYACELHLDLIARGGLVWIDDDPVPLNLEQLPASRNPHPDSPRDEDAFSPTPLSVDLEENDCCGVLGRGGPACLPS